MKNIQYTSSPGVPHGSMADEFLSHKNGSEWWYCTGYLNDDAGKLFSFQFTLAKVIVYGIRLHILMTALSDTETGKHYYSQQAFFFGQGVTITPERVGAKDQSEIVFGDRRLDLNIAAKDYALSLAMDVTKPPIWHCDEGVLRMGLDDPQETTYYWSYTNLAATGTLTIGDRTSNVTGKAWFDRQGGTYNIINRWTHWEWFSLRFFDNEEVMLFAFPQSGYQDGTYIDREGCTQRLSEYTITSQGFTEAAGHRFSFGWEVTLPGIKDEAYRIVPKMDGQLNLTYFELLADVIDPAGKCVGYCVVELLPGVYNENIKVGAVLARVN